MPYVPKPTPPQLWMERAKCQTTSVPDNWYPDRNAETYTPTVARAKAMCRGTDGRPPCPVLLECLAWSLLMKEKFGVWGGLSTRERNALRRSADLSRYKVVELLPPSPYKQMIQTYLEENSDGHTSAEAEEGASSTDTE